MMMGEAAVTKTSLPDFMPNDPSPPEKAWTSRSPKLARNVEPVVDSPCKVPIVEKIGRSRAPILFCATR